MKNNRCITLNTGYNMPLIGLGVWRTVNVEDVRSVITTAIELGYRHIDTAYNYKNEKQIGLVLEELFSQGKVKREELFITSKLWSACHKDPMKYFLRSLEDLKLEYLDLYLIHWPVTIKTIGEEELKNDDGSYVTENFDPIKIWKEMENIYKTGKVRSIGVSNFGLKNLKKILKNCKIPPAVNQIEIHPYCQQNEIVDFCRSKKITPVAYSPLGSYAEDTGAKPLKDDETIQHIAKKNKIEPSVVLLNFLSQRDIPSIPKSSSKKHLEQNLKVHVLTAEEIKLLLCINKNHKYRDPWYMGPDRYK